MNRPYDPAELDILYRDWPAGVPAAVIGARIGRSAGSVARAASYYQVRRGRDYLAEIRRQASRARRNNG